MLKRFSISLEEELLAQFDAFIRSRGYVNRSWNLDLITIT